MSLAGSDATQIRRRSAPRRAPASRSVIGDAYPRSERGGADRSCHAAPGSLGAAAGTVASACFPILVET